MKKQATIKKTTIFTSLLLSCCIQAFSQNIPTNAAAGDKDWHMGGNQVTATGSTVFGTIAGLPQPIFIYTNGTQRGVIDNNAGGFWGIGNFSTPQNKLHINEIAAATAVYAQWTDAITGAGLPTLGLQVGLDANANAQIIQNTTNLPIESFEHSTGGVLREASRLITEPFVVGNAPLGPGLLTNDITRMGIWSGVTGIGPFNPNPVSMLQIGDYWPANNLIGGYRDWMNVGIYMDYSSDNMYVGLRSIAPDKSLAELDWGNNPSNAPNGDVLVFNFAAAQGNFSSSSYPGLEVARMWSDGALGRMGIGGWTQSTIGGFGNNNDYTGGPGNPGNTLEVNSPDRAAIPGNSGLRFTDLNTTSNVNPNPGPGVLAVNSFGDVIYVKENAIGLGAGLCPTPTVLPSSAGYDMANNGNFFFAGNGAGSLVNNVGIGINCVTPNAKLEVLQQSGSFNTVGIYVENDDKAFGSYVAPPPTRLIGIKSFIPIHAPNFLNCYNMAGWFAAPSYPNFPQQYAIYVPPGPPAIPGSHGGMVSIGYQLGRYTLSNYLFAVNSPAIINNTIVPSDSILKRNVIPLAHGLDVIRQLSPISYKYNGLGGMDSSTLYYGLMAQAVNRVASYAVDSTQELLDSTSMTLTTIKLVDQGAIIYTAINGLKQLDAEINGGGTTGIVVASPTGTLSHDSAGIITQLPQVGGNSFVTSSDSRFKTGITSIPNALGIVENLNGVYFNWNSGAYPWKHFPSGQQVGFIAQQVSPYVPQVVTTDDSGYYAVDYGRITPVLVDAMKQQQNTIDSLKNILSSIQSCLSNLCDSNRHRAIRGHDTGNGSGNNTIEVTLSNAALLYQNTPNPFGSSGTKISYFLPENIQGATMVFYDMYGGKLKEVQLTQTGMGTININPSQLSNGVYSYSLVINGQVVDTKKMVFAK